MCWLLDENKLDLQLPVGPQLNSCFRVHEVCGVI